VISARYFPGNTHTGTAGHRVFILSTGLNGLWSTPYSAVEARFTSPDDGVRDDAIGHTVAIKQ